MFLGINWFENVVRENTVYLTKELLLLAKSFTSSVVTVVRFACLHKTKKQPLNIFANTD